MIINWAAKEIRTKVVYFGPAMSGKTTSIRYLFQKFSSLNSLESVETTTGRTLFFDFGCLYLKLGDWDVQVNIWSATGQDYYAGTRDTVLMGVDGIIFIADSHPDLIADNVRSWKELQAHFGGALGTRVPVIVCVNKSDLPDALSEKDLRSLMSIPHSVQVLQTIAKNGENIEDSFKSLLRAVFNGNN